LKHAIEAPIASTTVLNRPYNLTISLKKKKVLRYNS